LDRNCWDFAVQFPRGIENAILNLDHKIFNSIMIINLLEGFMMQKPSVVTIEGFYFNLGARGNCTLRLTSRQRKIPGKKLPELSRS
jgi:hypothetical protein